MCVRAYLVNLYWLLRLFFKAMASFVVRLQAPGFTNNFYSLSDWVLCLKIWRLGKRLKFRSHVKSSVRTRVQGVCSSASSL